jgi:hypothetical protein
METTTETEGRFNGFCRRIDFTASPRKVVGCGRFHSSSIVSRWSVAVVDCACGQKVSLRRVEGKVSKHECDDRCMSSTGFKCECKCGGKNHGASHAA